MVNLIKVSKKQCEELYEELNSIIIEIKEIKRLLDAEIVNPENDLVFLGNYQYKSNSFKNMSFNQIISVLNYLKSKSDYNENLNIDELIEKIKEWFINQLLEDAFVSKNPINYVLASKIDLLFCDIDALDEKYFQLDKSVYGWFTKKNLDKLEISLMNDLYEVKKKINELKNKEKLWFSLKADSDYIKRR